MPKTFKDGKSESSGISWWTSGFFPGSLWLIYEATSDAEIKTFAEKRLKLQEGAQRHIGNHDIGFMIFCSFGNAYRITGNKNYKSIIDTAAAWQIKRYKPTIRAIQSWNTSDKFKCPVIIDNMMNLEQLCWVTDNGGSSQYKQIAITHANTTLKNHFRKDNSSYHVVDYDINTGGVIKKVTHQGFADESAWSRGQAWGLYGYTMMYRFTKNKNI
ncbi:glycoside hydrolase family 88 protein [Niabella ginsengisoli]|uniref:Glycoside hydrolase family 88 protein n=1 Tax=Niabella ginsengisoli TaxID=522298 RepID=A0ABS9SF94_9BACT|nr:glycoside hydrolase family 88 protein [Niabella ginsengisoli]MCH5597020.1 glycoside hydrolase family 88 protein [Niabella ginsengisoli]